MTTAERVLVATFSRFFRPHYTLGVCEVEV
jgi:hypothetical protein